jgi:hypothetical protein
MNIASFQAGVASALAVCLLVLGGGCGGSDNDNAATPTPSPVTGKVHVSGNVTNKIDNSPISGPSIVFKGLDGKTAGTEAKANVIDGTYDLGMLEAGNYEVAITDDGDGIVPHVTQRVQVGVARLNFSVIKKGSC